MTFRFAKIFLALTTLGFATITFAQNDATGASMPNSAGLSGGYNTLNSIHGWHINGGFFFNRFSSNGTDYVRQVTVLPTSQITNYYHTGTNDHFGYDAGIGYYIDWMDADINLNYFGISTSDGNSVNVDNLYPLVQPVPLDLPYTWTGGRSRFSYTAWGLTLGHLARLSPFFDLYYYGGLNYTHYSKNISTTSTAVGNLYFTHSGLGYSGVGPTFGINGDWYPLFYYELPNFSFSGGVQSSFTYGNKSTYARVNNNGFLYIVDYPHAKIVVPVVSSNLAVNYLFQMNSWSLKVSLGYQDTVLFGVNNANDFSFNEANESLNGLFVNFTLRV